jgi:excisionase family DNA binding protein
MQKTASNGSGRLFYTVPEVSQMLAVNQKTVYRLLDRGLLKSSSAIRHKRIHAASLEQFISITVYSGGAK